MDHLPISWRKSVKSISKKLLSAQSIRIQGFEWNAKKLHDLKVWQNPISYVWGDTKKLQNSPRKKDSVWHHKWDDLPCPCLPTFAEGYGRKTTADYIRFLYIAYGSNCELETQALLCGDLGYIESATLDEFKAEIQAVERMLKALIKSLENK